MRGSILNHYIFSVLISVPYNVKTFIQESIMQTVTADRTTTSVKSIIQKIRHPRLVSFFIGPAYPIWIAFSVLVGRMTCLEVYFAAFDLLLIALGFLVCDSIKPIIPILTSFLYRIPLEHSPGTPFYSTYYSGAKFVLPIILFCIAIASLVAMLIRMRVFTKANLKSLPMLLPLSLLSLAFLLGGTFNDTKVMADFWFALLEVVVFALVFWLLYLGLKREDPEELCKYFVYVAGVLAAILILEVAHLYVAYDNVIVNGTINKGAIDFGWGISNTCGNCLTVLVPICFLGVIKSKYHYVYFSLATLAYVAAVLTLCRNAVLFGSIFYAACVILCCFFGERKKTYRVVAIGIIVCLIVLDLVFSKQVETLFANMIAHGLDDNGRYPLWKAAFDGFLEHPIFGNGFHSFVPHISRYASFIPFLAHNTVFELVYSMGAFGLIAYGVYRIYTVIPFIKKLSIEKVFLFLSIATLLVESLIDNYIFWFAPTFVYNIAIIIAIKYNEGEKAPAIENVKTEE